MMFFKKYRIVKVGTKKYPLFRVDKRHWLLFIPFFDIGASDMMPNYNFRTIQEAELAIARKVTLYKTQL